MTVLTTAPADRDAVTNAFAAESRLVVVSFCAAWCDTCNEFRVAYERIAAARPHAAFVWLDIEDDAAVAGDVDVENFPTLAVYRGGVPVHFGVSLPHESTVLRLIDALAGSGDAMRGAPPAVAELPAQMTALRDG
jgi:thioredoxin reductase (NADPH)